MAFKYNWYAIRKEYIEGNRIKQDEVDLPTAQELSVKYNIKVNTIEKRCAKEGWVQQRADFQAEVERIAREKDAKKRARDIESFDTDCHKVAKSGIWRLSKEMKDDQEAARDNKPLKPLSDVESIARSLERFQTVGHRALKTADSAIAITGQDDKPLGADLIALINLKDSILSALPNDPEIRKKAAEALLDATKG